MDTMALWIAIVIARSAAVDATDYMVPGTV